MTIADTGYRVLSPRASLADLGNIIVDPIPDGAQCFVNAVKETYYLDKHSGAPLAPPIVVSGASSVYLGARWHQNPGPTGPVGPVGPVGPQGIAGLVKYDFGIFEARPLIASAAYSDCHLWAWTDLTYSGTAGQTGATDLTLEAYRDTQQIKAFARHDQNNSISLDAQHLHQWCGTAVEFHLHLLPMGSVSGNAYFTGRYFFGNILDVLPAAVSWTPFAVPVPIVGTNQYKRQMSGLFLSPPPVTPTFSSILSIFFMRNGTDGNDTYTSNKDHGTLAANLCIESYDVHYQAFLLGSEEEHSGVIRQNPAEIVFDPSWNAGSVYLQMVVKSDLGNSCSFQLYDMTAAAAVGGSQVTITSSSYAMLEVGPLALAAGTHSYIIQARYNAGADEPKLASARFVVR
jgi:hypothetical protein